MRTLRNIIKFEIKLWIAFFVVAGSVTLTSSLFGSPSNKSFTMPTQAMAPTIKKGEKVKADMKAYEMVEPHTGDLAIFVPNKNSDLRWVFRVAAKPGDVISYVEGALQRNGILVYAPPPLQGLTFKSPTKMKEGAEIEYPYKLKETEYFFLSDDPSHMHDSRYWGTIEREQILGKLVSHR